MDKNKLLQAHSFPDQATAIRPGHCLFNLVMPAAFTSPHFLFHQILFQEWICCPGTFQISENYIVSRYNLKIIESSNHRMVSVGSDLLDNIVPTKDHLVPTPLP